MNGVAMALDMIVVCCLLEPCQLRIFPPNGSAHFVSTSKECSLVRIEIVMEPYDCLQIEVKGKYQTLISRVGKRVS